MRYGRVLLFLLVPLAGVAQKNNAPKQEALRLSCPLVNAMEVIEKQPYSLGSDPKVILSSSSDTTVKACIGGTVTNVQQDEEKKWIIVINYRNHYIWYSGVSRLAVREEQKVKNGDPVGFIDPGGKIELHVFDFETPVDPKKYLDCKW